MEPKRPRRHLSLYTIDVRILGDEYRDKDFTGRDICRQRY